ncbi:uncharacterized protein LOC111079087 isoform X2 [Drosophila obscura]|nr:uncharacterized protein LOC111079087 isoform X2 [Drosophila obscura]
MQFSWMKVAIYLLTFLTYAYSGYGSSTIVHVFPTSPPDS